MEATAASALGSQPARHPEHDTQMHWIYGGSTNLDNLILLCVIGITGWPMRVVGRSCAATTGRMLTIPPVTEFQRLARGPD